MWVRVFAKKKSYAKVRVSAKSPINDNAEFCNSTYFSGDANLPLLAAVAAPSLTMTRQIVDFAMR